MKAIVLAGFVLSCTVAVGWGGENISPSPSDSAKKTTDSLGAGTYAGAVVEIEIGEGSLKDLAKFERWTKMLDRADADDAVHAGLTAAQDAALAWLDHHHLPNEAPTLQLGLIWQQP